jgi:uracil-DNA glycosylase family 4
MIEQENYLSLLGIERWVLRKGDNLMLKEAEEEIDNQDVTWETLEQRVKQCQACPLHKTRKHTVFGTGNRQAAVMFIGEAPGAEEDRQGKPFVGRAGQLLTEMLRAINFSREEIFIANILKSRPPGNRDPLPEEVAQCLPYLKEQIQLVQPKLLVALGRIAAHNLLKTKTPLSRLRGEMFHFDQIPLLVTYHPAYLLRSPQDKSKAYEDLKKIEALTHKK